MSDPLLRCAISDELPEDLIPPAFISLEQGSEEANKGAIQAQIGLLRPFLEARSKTAYGLVDDEHCDIPMKLLRAKVDASGKIPIPVKRRSANQGSATKRQRVT